MKFKKLRILSSLLLLSGCSPKRDYQLKDISFAFGIKEALLEPPILDDDTSSSTSLVTFDCSSYAYFGDGNGHFSRSYFTLSYKDSDDKVEEHKEIGDSLLIEGRLCYPLTSDTVTLFDDRGDQLVGKCLCPSNRIFYSSDSFSNFVSSQEKQRLGMRDPISRFFNHTIPSFFSDIGSKIKTFVQGLENKFYDWLNPLKLF